MDCSKAKTFLSEWVDGRLAGTTRGDLEAHLGSCPACREEERGLRATWELLGDYPQIEPRPTLLQRVLARIRRPAFWKLLAPFAAAAAILVVVVAVVLSPAPRPQDPAITPEERELVEHLELLENYDAIATLEMVAPESSEAYLPEDK